MNAAGPMISGISVRAVFFSRVSALSPAVYPDSTSRVSFSLKLSMPNIQAAYLPALFDSTLAQQSHESVHD
jgi:hypothetical protein